ncbi:MAG: hypothetical protein ACYC3X_05540 [Pirellulaceae bacterium]
MFPYLATLSMRKRLLLLVLCIAAGACLAHVIQGLVRQVDSSQPRAAVAESTPAAPAAGPSQEMLNASPAATVDQAEAAVPNPAPSSGDQGLRELVVGTWEDDYQGKRTMTLKEDGTGSMLVELSGLQATLFAARLQFDMVWSLENGRLQKRTIGGQPEARVKMILKMMGDRVDEPILEVTRDRLLLLDKDGKTRYDWRRKK